MKITKTQLKEIIKEELRRVLSEDSVESPLQQVINADKQYGSPQDFVDKFGYEEAPEVQAIVKMLPAAKEAVEAIVKEKGTEDRWSDTIAYHPDEVPSDVREAWLAQKTVNQWAEYFENLPYE
jgi:hypothetical protein